MNRFLYLTIAVGLLVFGSGVLEAARTYKYRCPKCKLIQEYEIPGSKKCPNDGHTMFRMN